MAYRYDSVMRCLTGRLYRPLFSWEQFLFGVFPHERRWSAPVTFWYWTPRRT